MANIFYKRSDVVGRKYYRVPNYISADFSGIKAKEIIYQEGDRLEIIAERLFGNRSYWRALAMFNNIGYAFQLQPGDTIRIPYQIQQVLDRI